MTEWWRVARSVRILHILFQDRADSRRIAVDIFLHREERDVIASMFRSDASLVHCRGTITHVHNHVSDIIVSSTEKPARQNVVGTDIWRMLRWYMQAFLLVDPFLRHLVRIRAWGLEKRIRQYAVDRSREPRGC